MKSPSAALVTSPLAISVQRAAYVHCPAAIAADCVAVMTKANELPLAVPVEVTGATPARFSTSTDVNVVAGQSAKPSNSRVVSPLVIDCGKIVSGASAIALLFTLCGQIVNNEKS